MARRSAGILLYRRMPAGIMVLLAHPGGPFWRGRGAGTWQIPKGMIEPGEQPSEAARREVEEELGIILSGDPIPLGQVRQAGGKIVEAFALEQEFDPAAIRSNRFEQEWPPGSGKVRSFPEVDAARWMTLEEAGTMILPSQRPILDMLVGVLAG